MYDDHNLTFPPACESFLPGCKRPVSGNYELLNPEIFE
jgi:hypothetical protein